MEARTLAEPRLRVLIADDHPVVRAGVVAIVAADARMEVVCEAGDGVDAVDGWRRHAPDVALIDLKMPRMDGFETIAAIRADDERARVAVMTTLVGDEDVFRAIQAGAGGFVLKDCRPDELIDCLRAVARGQRYLDPQAAARLAERVTRDPLTEREQQVLERVAQGLSNKHIARQLGVAEGTVKTHVKAVLAKLGCRSRTQATRAAMARGLVPGPAEA